MPSPSLEEVVKGIFENKTAYKKTKKEDGAQDI